MASSISYFLFFSSLLFVSSSNAQSSFRPHALVVPISKDGSTLQYVTTINQMTPLVPFQLVVDLGGQFLWVDCEQNYVSSSYRPMQYRLAQCLVAKASGYGNFFSASKLGCNNNTTSCRSVSVSKFFFSYAPTSLLEGLASGAKGMAGLGRMHIALPSQFASAFNFHRKFSICLFSSTTIDGIIFLGDGPYGLLLNVDASQLLIYTPLILNPGGATIPTIGLVLQNNSMVWRIFGANSMPLPCIKDVWIGCRTRPSEVAGQSSQFKAASRCRQMMHHDAAARHFNLLGGMGQVGENPISHYHVKWKQLYVAKETWKLARRCCPLWGAWCYLQGAYVVRIECSRHYDIYPDSIEGARHVPNHMLQLQLHIQLNLSEDLHIAGSSKNPINPRLPSVFRKSTSSAITEINMGMAKRRRDEDDDNYEWMIRRCFPFNFARRIFFHGGGLDNSDGLTWIRSHKLGQGSFASVYSAKLRSKSPVVFIDDNGGSCIMPSELAVKSAETSKASSLRREMEILGVLNSSSYVVRCYGDEITRSGDGKLYYNLLLEKCCGGSLGSRIRNSGGVGLPENEVRCYTRDIVRGLCYIHGHGYVHCDIKPDNILLVPTCCNGFRAKIGDFGLAKEAYYDPADEDDEGCSGCWLSDIWALGCVVIEMITGKLVWSCEQFEGSDMRDLLRRIAYSPELPAFPSDISEQGRHFLESCLHRDIDERWSALMLLRHPFLSEDGQRSGKAEGSGLRRVFFSSEWNKVGHDLIKGRESKNARRTRAGI
ncbi:hypothetical protein AAG906_040602 [Vitis piasezkii]